jgi:hypothetical protein
MEVSSQLHAPAALFPRKRLLFKQYKNWKIKIIKFTTFRRLALSPSSGKKVPILRGTMVKISFI